MIEEQKNYELSFLIKKEEDSQKILDGLKHAGASVIHGGQTQRIRLSYPIKKENAAYFGYLYFSAEPKIIVNLDHQFKIQPEILRFSFLSLTAIPQQFSSRPASRSSYQPRTYQSRTAVNGAPTQKEIITEARQMPAVEVVTAKTKDASGLSNEELEKKLEEMLK